MFINASVAKTSAYKVSTGFARRLLMNIALPSVANANNFFVLDKSG
jgi:hypothetical protein